MHIIASDCDVGDGKRQRDRSVFAGASGYFVSLNSNIAGVNSNAIPLHILDSVVLDQPSCPTNVESTLIAQPDAAAPICYVPDEITHYLHIVRAVGINSSVCAVDIMRLIVTDFAVGGIWN